MPPTAEEVLKARQEEQDRQNEQWRRAYAAKQARQQREYEAQRIVLLAELATEAQLAVQRLSAKGFPDGELKIVVTGYKPQKRWWGEQYHTQTQMNRACWPIDTSAGPRRLQGYYLTSEPRVVTRMSSSHVDRRGRTWWGLDDVTSSDATTNDHLESLIKGIKQIAT